MLDATQPLREQMNENNESIIPFYEKFGFRLRLVVPEQLAGEMKRSGQEGGTAA